MSSVNADHILRVADLVDRPGASRPLDLSLDAPADLELEHAKVAAPIRLTGVVESVVDGLLIRGDLTSTVDMVCSRCLRHLTVPIASDVVELFADPVEEGAEAEVDPGYEIVGGVALDLDSLLRDALIPAVPYRALCDEACQGLCPQCGVDRAEADCDCKDETTDARWAALEALRLPDGD